MSDWELCALGDPAELEILVGKAQMIFFSYDARHPIWQFWEWPVEIRWGRLFHWVH